MTTALKRAANIIRAATGSPVGSAALAEELSDAGLLASDGEQRKVFVSISLRTGKILEMEKRRCDLSNIEIWKKRCGPVEIRRATLTLCDATKASSRGL